MRLERSGIGFMSSHVKEREHPCSCQGDLIGLVLGSCQVE
jgi:hypothetical protein